MNFIEFGNPWDQPLMRNFNACPFGPIIIRCIVMQIIKSTKSRFVQVVLADVVGFTHRLFIRRVLQQCDSLKLILNCLELQVSKSLFLAAMAFKLPSLRTHVPRHMDYRSSRYSIPGVPVFDERDFDKKRVLGRGRFYRCY